MILKNHTSIPDEYLLSMLTDAIQSYTDLYPSANSTVEFIIFDKMDELKKLREEITAETDNMDYDGSFLSPKAKTDTLTILALVKEKNLAGAEQYFKEKANGSLRDADIPDRETRGVRLMAFFEFAEMIQHEYSHLCSYENFMTTTRWADPHILGHDWNYHLHDEFIARYRGTRAMLHMMEPYAETDLLYSLWMGYWNDLNKTFQSHFEDVKKLLSDSAKGIETETLQYMQQNGLSGADMVEELEYELGHPLDSGGELSESGAPKMSPMEIVEFMTLEETEKMTIPLMYEIRNPYASYHGAQLFGLIQAFHDYMAAEQDGLELDEADLDLTEVMKTPYYDYVDAGKVKNTLEQFIETFFDCCKEEENDI